MKIRKRLSIIGVVLSIFFNSVFAYASDNNEVAGSSTESLQVQNFATCESMLALPDLNSLEENSDIIIKGKILPEHENVTLSALGYTRTKVQITKVYKGNVQVNDPILMDEEYWEVKDILRKMIQIERNELDSRGSFSGEMIPYFMVNDDLLFYRNQVDSWLQYVSVEKVEYNLVDGYRFD